MKRVACAHAAAAAALAACIACCAVAARAQGLPMARVNGVAITHEQLDRQFDELLAERRLNIARLQDPDKAKALKREALERLIGVELLWQQAQREGAIAGEAEVERALAAARERFRSNDAFLQHLQRRGQDEASHRAHVGRMLSADRYAQQVVEREVRVSERDIADFHALNKRVFQQPQRVRARHILAALPAGADGAAKARARRRIEALLARVRAGEDFEALARAHSDDATRSWGGELDAFGRGEQPKPIEDAAFALAPGAVSGVIETAAGFHIVKLEERLPARSVPLEAARDGIRAHLLRTRGQEAIAAEIARLRATAQVQWLVP
jgi:parvulin-like peptidyl-prolyl isomerase